MANNTVKGKGTNGNDKLIGDDKNNLLLGLKGNDKIFGNGGNDALFGGKGDDLLEGGDGVDFMLGGSGDDTLIGDKGDDFMLGGSGNDRMIWNNGDASDTMRGGTGMDVTEVNGAVDAGDEFELRAIGPQADFERLNLINFRLNIEETEAMEINGGGGDDSLTVEDLASTDVKKVTFDGGKGNDTLDAGASTQTIVADGGSGNDVIKSGSGDDTLKGGKGDDLIEGGEGIDRMYGNSGDDTLIGDKGDDFMFAGRGNDRMIWNNGDASDTMRGGAGMDVTEVNGAVDAGDKFELRAIGNQADFERLNLINFSLNIKETEAMEINGGGGNDSLSVEDLSQTDIEKVTFDGGKGNDRLEAGASTQTIVAKGGNGKDVLMSGSGDDTLEGGNGGDILSGGNGDDKLFGGKGNDLLRGGNGNDLTDGGDGNDTADFSDIPFAVNADLAAGTATYKVNGNLVQDTLVNIENLNGGDLDDTLMGDDEVNVLKGNAGDDTLIGRKGDDVMRGGKGNDRMIWNNGDGSDTMRGGAGQDVTEVNGALEAGDKFELGSNGKRVDFRRVNLGLFQLDIDGVESMDINGGGGDDSLEINSLKSTRLKQVNFDGGDGNDFLNGSGTDVSIFADGGAGDDILIGGSANDVLIGGDGANLLIGGGGNDTLIGGRDSDIFRLGFDGVSLLEGFNVTEGDMIQIQQDSWSGKIGSLGSADAMRDAMTYNSNNGVLAIDGVQIAKLQSPVGGFDINSHVEFV